MVTRSKTNLAAVAAFSLCVSSLSRGQEARQKPEVTIGEMRIQTVPAMSYLCTSAETSFEEIGGTVRAGLDKVYSAATQNKLLLARPSMLVYWGNPHFDPKKTFKMEIGVVISDDIRAIEGVTIRKTEPFKCAGILYIGTVKQQGQAYQKLIPALMEAGYVPTGEEREVCLNWEGAHSSNNIYWMQIGIK